MYDSAFQQYKWRNYADASAQLDALIADYPSADVIPAAESLAAACAISIARAEYDAGRYETALDLLYTYKEQYGATSAYTQLHAEIMETLTDIRPENGEILVNYIGSGEGEFTVRSASSDACIKLEDRNNPNAYLLFYVQAQSSATISVADGDYIVKYTTGSQWYGTSSMFGKDASYTLAEDSFEFETTYTYEYIYYSIISITLYAVPNGNLETTPISADAF